MPKKDDKIERVIYTVTLAGKRTVNTFSKEASLIDLISYLDRNYFTMSDLVKITKRETIIVHNDTGYDRFEEPEEDITSKVIIDTIPKVLGRRAENIVFDKVENP